MRAMAEMVIAATNGGQPFPPLKPFFPESEAAGIQQFPGAVPHLNTVIPLDLRKCPIWPMWARVVARDKVALRFRKGYRAFEIGGLLDAKINPFVRTPDG
jgi:hypothetical protein